MAVEEPIKRRCLVVAPCVPDTLRQPGEIITWRKPGKLPFYLRELSDEELEEVANVEAEQAKIAEEELKEPDVNVPGSPANLRARARKAQLVEAASLDQKDDNNWTPSGQPKLAMVNRALHAMKAEPTTRAELRMVAPNAVRREELIKQKPGAVTDELEDILGEK